MFWNILRNIKCNIFFISYLYCLSGIYLVWIIKWFIWKFIVSIFIKLESVLMMFLVVSVSFLMGILLVWDFRVFIIFIVIFFIFFWLKKCIYFLKYCIVSYFCWLKIWLLKIVRYIYLLYSFYIWNVVDFWNIFYKFGRLLWI